MPMGTTLTGPVTGGERGRPFSLPLTDLASVGYVAEEFFLEGTAAAYEAEPGAGLAVDGKWRVRPSRTAPFRTRVLVVRPVDAARFNGVVHVNWQNVSAGFELGTADFESEQLLDGFAWVGVSAQRVGVYGFPGGVQFGLRGWDPERYGTLDHPGDDFSFDIYTQAARAIGPAILGGGAARKLVASGASQSAIALRTYANAIQPMERLFDCFLFFLTSGEARCPIPGTLMLRRRRWRRCRCRFGTISEFPRWFSTVRPRHPGSFRCARPTPTSSGCGRSQGRATAAAGQDGRRWHRSSRVTASRSRAAATLLARACGRTGMS